MRISTVVIATLFLCVNAQAQVRKCIGPNGKVTYSDFVCGNSTLSETNVRTDANSIDSAGLRQDVQNYNSAKAVEQATQQGASKCKFSYYVAGDEKGKELATAAKQECLSNIGAKVTGQATSLEAYNFWKDHQQLVAARRSTAAANRPMNCRANGFGGMLCN